MKQIAFINVLRGAIGVLTIGMVGLLPACSHHQKAQQEDTAIRVQTTVVAPQEYAASSRYVGIIEAASETPLSMQLPGRVLSVQCKEGERVKAGKVLLTIDSTQQVNALRSAKAALEQAQDGYERAKTVHEQGVITDQKWVEIESRLTQARSMYDAARQQVRECRLVAPCDGVVSGLKIQVGQSIVPGMRVLALLDTRAFSVRFSVPEAEAGAIQVGGKGKVECTALDTLLPIVVTEKNIAANPLTHSYETVARIQGGNDILLAGMVAKVMVEDRNRSEAKIVIPARCVLLTPSSPTVWVVEQATACRREISVGGYLAEGVLVTSGLQVGDTLITEGYQKLYKGAKVMY